jgi:hypothetical protein
MDLNVDCSIIQFIVLYHFYYNVYVFLQEIDNFIICVLEFYVHECVCVMLRVLCALMYGHMTYCTLHNECCTFVLY